MINSCGTPHTIAAQRQGMAIPSQVFPRVKRPTLLSGLSLCTAVPDRYGCVPHRLQHPQFSDSITQLRCSLAMFNSCGITQQAPATCPDQEFSLSPHSVLAAPHLTSDVTARFPSMPIMRAQLAYDSGTSVKRQPEDVLLARVAKEPIQFAADLQQDTSWRKGRFIRPLCRLAIRAVSVDSPPLTYSGPPFSKALTHQPWETGAVNRFTSAEHLTSCA
jgi:hypothetical protein